MSAAVQEERWVWVIIQDPGREERFLGQVLEDTGERFIPAFPEKEAARQGLYGLARDREKEYEVQAILLGDLITRAGKEGLAVYLLDAEGRILEKTGN